MSTPTAPDLDPPARPLGDPPTGTAVPGDLPAGAVATRHLPAGTPDADSRARTHLANERTFLAWFRTGLTLIALGIAAAQFLARDVVAGIPVVSILASVLVVTGVSLATLGAWRYQRARWRIDAAAFEPAHWSVVVTTAAAVVTGVLAIAFVWLLHG